MDNRFSVDRILLDVAVLEDAVGNCVDVPLCNLPEGITEGMQLRLVDGSYHIDEQETASRRQKILELQNRLKKQN